MLGNTTPNYLYEIISHHKLEETIKYTYDEDINKEGNTIEIKYPYKVKILSSTVSSIPYKEILQGIANYEQGREPSICQSVYFININKNIIFNMYDDRGCIIFSNSKDRLINLYQRYNEWLVDYWRVYIDNIFKEI
ncbi:DUF3885 domain-containing protein [Terrisporobacter glycolicus]|uniref:DUF3885 domain-containing protein n=1 Tax=Terrisporobacter glycolicus ATCC 14880 = DSM 1288 TaxID=1121315 RepID=A0ABZ2EV93_9FIRM|nr:DUF3885 domain-containing protein [Terrisporobacter glycolicus]